MMVCEHSSSKVTFVSLPNFFVFLRIVAIDFPFFTIYIICSFFTGLYPAFSQFESIVDKSC